MKVLENFAGVWVLREEYDSYKPEDFAKAIYCSPEAGEGECTPFFSVRSDAEAFAFQFGAEVSRQLSDGRIMRLALEFIPTLLDLAFLLRELLVLDRLVCQINNGEIVSVESLLADMVSRLQPGP